MQNGFKILMSFTQKKQIKYMKENLRKNFSLYVMPRWSLSPNSDNIHILYDQVIFENCFSDHYE